MIRTKGNKVGVIGAGQVGATTAYTLLLSGLVSEMVLVDLNAQRAQGEALDMSHGMPLCPPAEIVAGDYPLLEGADVVIITAGANQKPGETRLDLTRRNVRVFQDIVPKVVRYAPNAILLVVTNPVDVLTYETIRLSGLPKSRVIGSGTVLDTSRLRYLLSRHTNVDARNIHTYVLGEHGDSELAAWSLTRVAGMDMDAFCGQCRSCKDSLSRTAKDEFDAEVRRVAYTIIEQKGATYYAVAVAVRRIVEAVLRDERAVLTVSSYLDGEMGLKDVCLSLPCIIGREGIEKVLEVPLDAEEMANLRASAGQIRQAIGESK